LLFILVGLAFTRQGLFGGEVLLLRDLQGLFHPWSIHKLRTIAGGEFPLWNPYTLFGQPFMANPQTAVMYGLSYIYGLIPFSRGITAYVLVHLLIASTGMYWFSRELGMGRAGAALTGIIFAFGGWMVKMWEFASVIGTVAWTPLLLALTQRALRGKVFGLLLGGSAILATQVFAGHPMMVAFTVLAAGWLVVSGMIFPGGERKQARRALGALVAACAFAVLLSLIQLIPTVELASRSPRVLTPHHLASATSFALHPAELGNFLIPYLFGFPEWQKCFYIGLLPVMLAVFGLLSSKAAVSEKGPLSRMLLFASGLIIMGSILALGGHTPVYPLLCRAIKPFWSLFHWPGHFMFFAYLGTGLIAGMGLDALLSGHSRRPRAICLIAGSLALGALVLYARPQIIDVLRSSYRVEVLALRNPRISPAHFPAKSIAGGFLLASVLCGAALLVAGLARIPRSLRVALLLGATVVELLLFGSRQVFFSPVDVYARKPLIASRLEENGELFRLAAHPVLEPLGDLLYGSHSVEDFSFAAETIRADTGLLFGTFRTYGWRGLASREALGVFARLSSAELDSRARSALFELCGVKYLINLEEDDTGLRAPLAVASSYLPRAFFVPRARWFRDPGEVLQVLLSPDFDPQRVVLLLGRRERTPAGEQPSPSEKAWVGDISYTSNTVRLRCKADAPGYVFLSDSYYPGWRAYVNGEAADVVHANYAFRAVRVLAGESEIAFIYRPSWFPAAAAVSAASWVLLLVGALLLSLRSPAVRKRLRATQPTH